MRLLAIGSFLLFFANVCFSFPTISKAHQRNFLLHNENIFGTNYSPFVFSDSDDSPFRLKSRIVETPVNGGIKEDIPKKFSGKYQKWKTELLSTDFGRQQWDFYANNKQFILTIKLSDNKEQGAKTDDYLWDESGNFVGATITLGSRSDKGFPDPVYYPVMNSLSSRKPAYSIEGDILAATKIAHEIGHVNQTFKVSKETFQLQNKLTPVYISIFLKNGHNSNDQNLIDLAGQMGGTPMKIWENREYWSEVNAMLYLNEKIGSELFYCNVLNKMRRNIETYAKNYEERFDQIQVSVCDK